RLRTHPNVDPLEEERPSSVDGKHPQVRLGRQPRIAPQDAAKAGPYNFNGPTEHPVDHKPCEHTGRVPNYTFSIARSRPARAWSATSCNSSLPTTPSALLGSTAATYVPPSAS